MSLLGDLYGDRFQTLVLAEHLSAHDRRRGLQDGLGLSREDFGLNSVVLFEQADALIERADRRKSKGSCPSSWWMLPSARLKPRSCTRCGWCS